MLVFFFTKNFLLISRILKALCLELNLKKYRHGRFLLYFVFKNFNPDRNIQPIACIIRSAVSIATGISLKKNKSERCCRAAFFILQRRNLSRETEGFPNPGAGQRAGSALCPHHWHLSSRSIFWQSLSGTLVTAAELMDMPVEDEEGSRRNSQQPLLLNILLASLK